jgi:hypothetical protein
MNRRTGSHLGVITLAASLLWSAGGCTSSHCSPGEVPNDVLKACVVPKKCEGGTPPNDRNECVSEQASTMELDAGLVDAEAPGAPGPIAGSGSGASGRMATAGGGAGSSASTDPVCGNGTREAAELCDGADCPTACESTNACLVSSLEGSSASCDAHCVSTEVTECRGGDGCCGKSCKYAEDTDCSKSCGDGVVDAPEICEPTSTEKPCLTSCDDANPCTQDTKTGSPEQCNVTCTHVPITALMSGDGCCPTGANANGDSDCRAKCGNGFRESNETCDGDCPTACDDGDPCTDDELRGDAAKCTAACTRTPRSRIAPTSCDDDNPCTDDYPVDSTSECTSVCRHDSKPRTGPRSEDECDDDDVCTVDSLLDSTTSCSRACKHDRMARTGPSSCDDGDPCTKDSVVNDSGTCTSRCLNESVTSSAAGDGCCAEGANKNTDNDCPAKCGNSVAEPGEACDIGGMSAGNEGLRSGAIYDASSCDAGCNRLYAYTPCTTNNQCGNSGVCSQGRCTFSCDGTAPLKTDDGDSNGYNCIFGNGRHGLCFGDVCWMKCETSNPAQNQECPNALNCGAYGGSSPWKLCCFAGA